MAYTEENATYEVVGSSDNPSNVEIPTDVNPYFGDGDDEFERAYNFASDLAHEHDGKDYRVTFKVENLETGETEAYLDNLTSEEEAEQMVLTKHKILLPFGEYQHP